MSIRLVYDSPMLVQRDEVAPTLVINPNNPPPWLQNSTTQQIVYVQQNYVPQQFIQQTDQVYLQQYAYQNPIYVQNYDPRIQIVPNIVTNERMLVPVNQQMQDELKKQQNQMAQIFVPINQQTYQLDGDKLKEQQRQMTFVQMNQQVHQDTNQPMTQTFVQMNQPTHTNQQDGDKLKEQNQRITQTFVPTNQQTPAIQDGDKLKQQSQYFQQIRPKRPIQNVRPRFMYRQIQPRLRYMSNVIQRIQIPNISTPNILNTNVLNPISITNNCAIDSGNVGSNISALNTHISRINNSGNITNTLNPMNNTTFTNNGTSNMSNVGTDAVQENMSVDNSLKDMSIRNSATESKISEINIGTNLAKTNKDNTSLSNGKNIVNRVFNTSQANIRPYSINEGTGTTEVKTIGVVNDGLVNANASHRLPNVSLSVTPMPNNTANVYIVGPLSQTVRPSSDANVGPLSTYTTPTPTTNIGPTNTLLPVSNAPNHTKPHSNVPSLLPLVQMNVPINSNSTNSSAILKTNSNIGKNIPNFGNTTSNVKSKNAPTQTNIGMMYNTLKNIVGPTNPPITITRIENRKRKSESPDEIKNKLHILDINTDVHNINVNMQHQTYNKIKQNNVNCDKNMQIYNKVMQSADKDILSDNMQIKQHADAVNDDTNIQDTSNQIQNKEKLVRNTVFTQARGRILNVNDNITIDPLNIEKEIDENIRKDMEIDGNIRNEMQMDESIRKDMQMDGNIRNEMQMDGNIRNEMQMDGNIRNEMQMDGNKVNKGFKRKDEGKKLIEKSFVLTHVLDGFVIQESNVAFPIRKPTIEKTIRVDPDVIGKDLEEVIPSIAIVKETNLDNESEIDTEKELETVNRNLDTKDIEKSEVKSQSKVIKNETIETKLGFRNSNVKNKNSKKRVQRKKEEKMVDDECNIDQGMNRVEDDRKESKENASECFSSVNKVQNIEEINEEEKDISVHIENLKRMENEEIGRKENENEIRCIENPFSQLTPSVIKTWTVEQLTDHLSKNGWSETASAFFEHEIDGESLLLVSKTQLLSIGVKDEKADIIIQFVNS